MADYANLTTVKAMLSITGSDHDARLALLNGVASRELEEAAGLASGTSWGSAVTPLARTFYADGSSDTLRIWPPVRTITSLTVDGQALTEGTDYVLTDRAGLFAQGLYRLTTSAGWAAINRDPYAPGWDGTVVVTAHWADQGYATVDPLIVEAANVLVAGYVRRDQASDGEVSGPEGLSFRPSNPWNDPRVKRFLDRYGTWVAA